MSKDCTTCFGSQTPIPVYFYLKWGQQYFVCHAKAVEGQVCDGVALLQGTLTAQGLTSITFSLPCLGYFQQSLLCSWTIYSAMVLHVMLQTASKFQVLDFHPGSVLDSVRCLSAWFVWWTCMVLKNELNHNFGVRAVLNWGHFAGSLPLRSLSQCFKVGDCATIILYCPFYAKVSLSFYIPLKSKAILEHLILFNLFTLAA